MTNPLPPGVHRGADVELPFHGLEWRSVSVRHHVADQIAIIADGSRSLAVADSRRPDNGTVVAHVIDEPDETVIQALDQAACFLFFEKPVEPLGPTGLIWIETGGQRTHTCFDAHGIPDR